MSTKGQQTADSREKQRETCLQPSTLCLLIALQLAVHILYGFSPHVLLHHLHHMSALSMQGIRMDLLSRYCPLLMPRTMHACYPSTFWHMQVQVPDLAVMHSKPTHAINSHDIGYVQVLNLPLMPYAWQRTNINATAGRQ